MTVDPDAIVGDLPGVGEKSAAALARLDIFRLRDLLLHFPHRYQDRTRDVPLAELRFEQECQVTGEVIDAKVVFTRRRTLLVTIGDGTAFLTLRFFHFNARQRAAVRPGVFVRCFGLVRPGPNGREMVHPEYRVQGEAPSPPEEGLTPVYASTEGVSQARLRGWIKRALPAADRWATDPGIARAIRFLHQPPVHADAEQIAAARRRVALDELTAHYLAMKRRHAALDHETGLELPPRQQLGRALLERLGFELTGAQKRVTREILEDLSRQRPMWRLLQGDVGAGKTVVAAFAAVRAAEHGAQTAVMAPTEILAEQHYLSFSSWLAPLGIEVVLLSGQLPARTRRARLAAIAEGRALVSVGTHALFQRDVAFHELGLVIIDEQHRFGVHQRMALRDKGRTPHQLVMTATPIPRTLTMAMYADMDVSLLDELPPGRRPIRTASVPASRRDQVISRLAASVRGGAQAYWVCTLIEDSDAFDARSAESVREELAERVPDIRIAVLHGRMPAAEKAEVMRAFKEGETQLLVATTVIEVGVDVANASVMVIENPERLGLAQLHQLRGRVGRGAIESHCVLLYAEPLGQAARARLGVLRRSNDGFHIAEEDLALRGPGEILGTRQTGAESFKVADLVADAALIGEAAARGQRLLERDPAAAAALIGAWSPAAERQYATA